MKKMPLPVLLAWLICSGGICWAISIAVTGNWSETIDSDDLQAGAGSDLIDTYESAVDAVYIDISGAAGNWTVSVRADTEPPDWHSNLQLHVKRTSDGSGPGPSTISGGTTYQEVTDTDQSFFSGYLGRSDINVQLKVSGVSTQLPAYTYTTTVYYTVSD
jgi:hypothetical protein